MKCPKCQHENAAGSAFCDECGARLAASCPACGEANRADAKFCRKCGQLLEAAPTGAAPESYTPKHLANKILTSRAALEGERKQVTVLFADLKGSMELLAERDPEEARKILDPVLERMMEAVHRYEGTVNQVMGDGIMALFGAPLAHEDHAVRACYAALRMQHAVKDYASVVQRTAGVPIQIRVGVNSGEVVVRSIDSDLKMDYTAVGQTAHLAARMEQMAMAGSILLTADTLRLAEDFVEVRSLGPASIKGLADPIEVYEAIGAGAARRRFDASAIRGLTRFVGRVPELDQLRRSLELARAGHGQIVAVVGEPGVGKTRLFHEFTHSHRTSGWLIVESGSDSYGKATPFLPLIDLVKAYFQVEPRDDVRRVREKVTGKLLALDRALEPALPALLTLLDVPVEELHWTALDPSQRRTRTLDACKRLLLRESQVQPMLLVFEDLHWIDSETQAFLDSLLESLPTVPVLLLVNYRPEYEHRWASKTFYTQLRVQPLRPETAAELLDSLLGTDAGLVPLKRLLIQKTEGNPFFLEESVRTLVETRALSGNRGACRLEEPVGAIRMPATVQSVLAARIDRLPPGEKRLLQMASVIGHEIPYRVLEAVAQESAAALRPKLAHLQVAEFLFETRLFPELEYCFKHALTHEVAYKGLLQAQRKELHEKVLAAIEGAYGDRIGEHVESLARHALLAEAWDKAVDYLRKAGAVASARGTYNAVLERYEQAFGVASRLPKNADNLRRQVDAHLDLSSALRPLGQFSRALELLKAAEPLAQELGDRAVEGRIAVQMSWLLAYASRHHEGLERAQRAQALAESIDDAELRLRAMYVCGMHHAPMGDVRAAIRSIEPLTDGPSAQFAKQIPDPFSTSLHLNALCWSALRHTIIGEFAKAFEYSERSHRFAEELAAPRAIAHANHHRGLMLRNAGEIQKALSFHSQALTVYEQEGMHEQISQAALFVGRALADLGRAEEGVSYTSRGIAFQEQRGFEGNVAALLVHHAITLAAAGRTAEAHRYAERALQLSRTAGQRLAETWALIALGRVLFSSNVTDAEVTAAPFLQALAICDDLGLRPDAAHCHLFLGRIHRRAGADARAREHLATAANLYREMSLPIFLKEAEAELAED